MEKLEISNVARDVIFPSFIYSATINVNNDEIVKECLSMQEQDPEGMFGRSNTHGWHSKNVCDIQNPDTDNLNDLANKTLEFAQEVINNENLNVKLSKIDWWVNINNENCYNILHSHPKADLLAVYYPKIVTKGGNLVLLRNDGSMHSQLYSKQKSLQRFAITPTEARLYIFPSHLLHYVETNLTTVTRISIASNIII